MATKPTSTAKKPVQPGAKKPVAKPEPKAPKLPKSLAECADLLYTIRQERLAKDKEAAALKAKEFILTEHLIANLPKSSATGVAGKVARVTAVSQTIPQVADWDKLQGYILANGKKNPGVFSLLQRRLGDTAVKEMWAAGKTVPGVEPFDLTKLSINKV